MSNGAKIALALVAGAGVFAGIVTLVPQRDGAVAPEDAQDVAAVSEEAVAEEAVAEEAVTGEAVTAEAVVAEQAVVPQVDTLRVEPDGMTVVAGRAAAGATVAVVVGGEVLAEVMADGAGAFVAMLDLPPSDQPRALTVVADPAGAAVESEGIFLVAPTVPEDADVAALAEEPSERDTATPDETVVPAEEAAAETGTETGIETGIETAATTEAGPAEAVVAEAETDGVTEVAPAEANVAETAGQVEDPAGEAVAAATDAAETPEEDVADEPQTEAATGAEVIGTETAEAGEIDGPGAGDVVSAVTGAEVADAPGVTEAAEEAAVPAEGDVVAAVIGGEVSETPGPGAVAETPGAAEAAVPAEGDVVAAVIGGDAADAVGETDVPGVTETAEAGVDVAGAETQGAETPGAETQGAETPGAETPAAEAVVDEGVSPGVTATEEVALAETPGAEVSEVVPVVVDEAPGLVAPVAEEVAAPPVLVSDAEGVRVMQPALAPGAGPEVFETVAVDAIAYDAEGAVDLSGRAAGGGTVRIYVDNAPIADIVVDPDGQWKADLTALEPGVYTLRVDQLDETGAVMSRMETPFLREDRADIAAVMAEETAAEGFEVAVQTVQPGNTLWAIARDRYGDGVLYVKVFEANRDRIRNPDLIYPGQIFVLPEETGAP